MDSVFAALALLALFVGSLFLVLPIIAMIRSGKAEKTAKKNDERLAELEKRIHNLDRGLGEARDVQSRLLALEAEVEALKKEIAAGAAPPTVGEVVEREPKLEVKPTVPPPVSTPPPAKIPKPQLRPIEEVVTSATRWDRAAQPATGPTPPPPATASAPPPVAPTEKKASSSLEETLGTDWLNKLGIIILVLGIVFFLGYQIQHVGPAEKILTGYLTSLALMGLGVFYERRARGESWRGRASAAAGRSYSSPPTR